MLSERELVEKWHTQVFRPAQTEIERLLAQFPDRRAFSISFTQCGADYRFTAPLLSDPDRTLEAGRRALFEFAADEIDEPVDTDERVYLRVTDTPDRIRQPLDAIRAEHLDRLVAVDATVESCDAVRPRIVTAAFRCERCGEECTVAQRGPRLHRRTHCPSCTAAGTLTLVPNDCAYVDSQTISVTDGGRTLPVSLEHDLTGSFEPGADVAIVAIPRGRVDGDATTVDVELEALSAHRRRDP